MSVPPRFLGYAFSVGDVLLELSHDFTIENADGATQSILGVGADGLKGTSFLERLPEADRDLLKTTVSDLKGKQRLGPVELQVQTETGGFEKLAFFVSTLPTGDSNYYFVFSRPYRLGLSRGKEDLDKPTEKKKQDFMDKLESLLVDNPSAEDDLIVTVIEAIGGQTLDDGHRQEVERYLKSFSVGGSHAASLGGDKFAIVHDKNGEVSNADEIQAKVSQATGLELTSASIDAYEAKLTDQDGVKALAFSLQRFAENSDGFDIADFSDPAKLMGETTERVRQFRRILDERSFSLVYQPIVTLTNGMTHHFEALSRFDIQDSPYNQFEMITFAEDVGLINEFDQAVIGRVIKRLRQLQSDKVNVSMAANVSGRSLSSQLFMDDLIEVLAGAEDLKKNLSLEITESAKIADLDALAKVLDTIRAMGFKVYLDDFGAGVSGFQYLRQLRVDALKIDGMYIREATENATDRAFLRSMVTLCQELGIETVGEWVETEGHAALLKSIGVDYGQGYYFGKPSAGLRSGKIA